MWSLGQVSRWALGSALVLTALPALGAAGAAELPGQRPTQLVAVNPVFLPFGTLTAEYEFRVTGFASLGLSAWYEYADVRARWLYLKALVYPWGKSPSGFSVGPTFGLLRAYRDPGTLDQLPQDSTPTIGAMAQYNFLFGPHDLFLLGAGIGGRTPLLHVSADSPIERLDGDVRLVAGLAF